MHISKISFLWLIGHKRITWSFFFFFNHSLSSKLVIKMIKCILGSIFIINITSIGGFSVDFSSLFHCDWCDGVWFRKEKGWCGWRPCRVLTSIDKCSFVAASPLTSPSLSSCFLRSFIPLHTLVSISIPILSETPIKKPHVFWLSLRSTPSNPSLSAMKILQSIPTKPPHPSWDPPRNSVLVLLFAIDLILLQSDNSSRSLTALNLIMHPMWLVFSFSLSYVQADHEGGRIRPLPRIGSR